MSLGNHTWKMVEIDKKLRNNISKRKCPGCSMFAPKGYVFAIQGKMSDEQKFKDLIGRIYKYWTPQDFICIRGFVNKNKVQNEGFMLFRKVRTNA